MFIEIAENSSANNFLFWVESFLSQKNSNLHTKQAHQRTSKICKNWRVLKVLSLFNWLNKENYVILIKIIFKLTLLKTTKSYSLFCCCCWMKFSLKFQPGLIFYIYWFLLFLSWMQLYFVICYKFQYFKIFFRQKGYFLIFTVFPCFLPQS